MGPVFLAFAAVMTFGDPTRPRPLVQPPPKGMAVLPRKPPSLPAIGTTRVRELAVLTHSVAPIVPTEPYSPPVWRAAENVVEEEDRFLFYPSYDYRRAWGCSS